MYNVVIQAGNGASLKKESKERKKTMLETIQKQIAEVVKNYRDGLLSTQEYFDKLHLLTMFKRELENGNASILWDAVK